MDIASDYGSEGWEFESLRVHFSNTSKHKAAQNLFLSGFFIFTAPKINKKDHLQGDQFELPIIF